jgi:hypothetical protein
MLVEFQGFTLCLLPRCLPSKLLFSCMEKLNIPNYDFKTHKTIELGSKVLGILV